MTCKERGVLKAKPREDTGGVLQLGRRQDKHAAEDFRSTEFQRRLLDLRSTRPGAEDPLRKLRSIASEMCGMAEPGNRTCVIETSLPRLLAMQDPYQYMAPLSPVFGKRPNTAGSQSDASSNRMFINPWVLAKTQRI